MNYDLIALDVDGTLLNESHMLTDGTKEAVREAARRGAEIVLCTGRGPVSTLPMQEGLGLTGTMITHNGAATVNAAKREVIHLFSLDSVELQRFTGYCRERGIHFDLNTAFEMYIESLSKEAEEMYRFFHAEPILQEPGMQLPDGLVKFTAFGSKETLDAVEREWESWSTGLKAIRSGDLFIDVQHPDADKGSALEQFARLRGVDRSRIMAIGNYFNDIGMLRFAGLGIAMDNSPDAVKAAADALTSSNEEDGVKHAFQEFLW